jgi:hypothetical protein
MMIFLDPSFGGTPPKAQKVVLPTEDEGVYRIPLSLPVLAGGIYFRKSAPSAAALLSVHPDSSGKCPVAQNSAPPAMGWDAKGR